MSYHFPPLPLTIRARLKTLDTVLQHRWVQCGLFATALVVFWLLNSKTAFA